MVSTEGKARFKWSLCLYAFSAAGIPMEKAAGSKTSVYVGALGVDYNRFFEADEEVLATYRATGTNGAILSNRLSWFYDLRGPSMTIETACSGSLIALHLACQSIRNKESKMVCADNSCLYVTKANRSTEPCLRIAAASRAHDERYITVNDEVYVAR